MRSVCVGGRGQRQHLEVYLGTDRRVKVGRTDGANVEQFQTVKDTSGSSILLYL